MAGTVSASTAKPRRKRVQVGWWCDHEHEPCGEGTHLSAHGKWVRGKFRETYAEPSVRKSASMLDHKEPKKKPPCPLAVPMYVMKEA